MSVWVRTGTVAFVLAGIVLAGTAMWTRSALLAALGGLVLLLLAAGVAAAVRYSRLRILYLRERASARRVAERRRLADEVHGLVGHELSLIGMQAGLLELRTDGETARMAAELRERAASAVAALHDTVALIGEHPAAPVGVDLGVLADRFRSAGGEVTVTGTVSDAPAPVRVTVHAVLREGLTNAARHAPGRPVEVCLDDGPSSVTVSVVSRGATAGPGGSGHGLDALRRRVEALGGDLEAGPTPDGHALVAVLPCDGGAVRVPEVSLPPAPLRTLVRQAVVPVGAVLLVVAGFHTWASHSASIEPGDEAALVVGAPAAEVLKRLPDRQAPIRLVRPPSHPAGWDCRFYTDGNVPLAIATVEVCLDAGSVARVTDLAARPLW